MKLNKKLVWLATMVAGSAQAGEINNLQALSQTTFKQLSEDLAGVVSYKTPTPAEPMGVTGFDLGLALTVVDLEHRDAWKAANSSGDGINSVVVPRLTVQKGLPFGFDVGIAYVPAPGTNVETWGGEIKYALYEGSALLPAVAVRGTHSEMVGVDDLEFSTNTFDLSVSKGFPFVTPYFGIGRAKTESKPQNTLTSVLNAESFSDRRTYLGVVLSPGLFSLTLERDATGDVSSYNVKLSMGF